MDGSWLQGQRLLGLWGFWKEWRWVSHTASLGPGLQQREGGAWDPLVGGCWSTLTQARRVRPKNEGQEGVRRGGKTKSWSDWRGRWRRREAPRRAPRPRRQAASSEGTSLGFPAHTHDAEGMEEGQSFLPSAPHVWSISQGCQQLGEHTAAWGRGGMCVGTSLMGVRGQSSGMQGQMAGFRGKASSCP